ncbi:MAG: TonB-dependent hemoglobin/transferrin/lactoferrin family receptor [Pseudomonadales bacterium]|nr:TonB-dependent hemoglobin/transferrin/lactoferrin family receptor [Pseudomonadales bacterium]
MARKGLCIGVLVAAVSTASTFAAEDPSGGAVDPVPSAQPLDQITVVGTRTERSLDQIDATVSIIDREDIERLVARDIQDMVRYEPGVTVGGGGRFGLDGFTIRGIGGNRVLTVVDNIRVPEEFSFGPFLSSRRDFVDVDSLQRAEIARGPISTLYGSDALGGVVALTTLGPEDLVSDSDPLALDAKAGYSSEDDSTVTTLRGAFGNQRLAGMLTYTRRDASELETAGDVGGTGFARTQADPQDIAQDNLNARVSFAPAEGHRLTATVDRFENETDSRILSDYGTSSRGSTVLRRDAADQRERTRYSLNYEFEGDLFLVDRMDVTLYRQESETVQNTLEDQQPPGGAPISARGRRSVFDQEIEGLLAIFGRSLELGPTDHTITFGGEYYTTDNLSLRDGTDDGEQASGFPTRDFPATQVRHRALFLQDEIVLFGDRLRLMPGLRWDDFRADVTVDETFETGKTNPITGELLAFPEDYADDQLTFKFGAVFGITEDITLYGRYSEGFRAPPYDDVNVGFSNFFGGYKSIAAPDLESETSAGVETGLRFRGSWGDAQLAVFRTEFDNFIQPFAIAPQFAATGGIDPADGLRTFQAVNLGEVEIEGWEARGTLALGSFSDGLDAFFLRGAAAYARGEDTETGAAINTVDPLNVVVGLGWRPASARWDAELVWTWSADKDEEDIDRGLEPDRPVTDSWYSVDLLGHVDLTERVRLDVGLFNLTDERFVRWADVAGIGPDDAVNRFSRPGRNFGATVRASL